MDGSIQSLDVFKVPLADFSLIEASAGTGKTYTIAGLYLRLVVEAGHPVNRILVVTYTRAATEELRDRIRKRLVQVRETFLQSGGGDDFCQRMLAHCEQLNLAQELIIRRLSNAVRGFDEAAIFTIHGFCQRVLTDRAFESGMPFVTELLADQRELLQEIVDDFWRREFYGASPMLVNYLLDKGYSPEDLLQEIKPYVGKPYLKVLDLDKPPEFESAEQSFTTAYAEVRQLWRQAQAEIEDLLSNNTCLNAKKYPKTSIRGWCKRLAEYLAWEAPNLKLFKPFEKFTASHLAESVRKGQTPPCHDFFQACDELQAAHGQLAAHYRHYLLEQRARLLTFCNAELESRKRRKQVQFYDDLLINLQRELRGARGETLAKAIHRHYSAALIDEFQDTDPLQYDIFHRIYSGTGLPVFMVGDPKQAIYSFRGADIFTYLTARHAAAQRYTLRENWRSDPNLIAALNALFSNTARPFLFEDIPFQPCIAAVTDWEPLRIQDASESPLQIWFLDGDDEGKALSKARANEWVARCTAAEIARLLNLAASGAVRIGERPLEGGDIAVLVRSHRQARLLREQLLRLGVPSVQQAQDNVFTSPEAQQLEAVLLAVAEPGREQRVRAALATDLFGLSGEELYRLSEDEQAWEERLNSFHDYHTLWREQGFIRMFRQLLNKESAFERLLSFRDGERRLTNVLHLAELLQSEASRCRPSMEGLLKWLRQRRQSQASEDEQQQLRLESDERLVKIVTVHKSKGLEYPIVFCPFLWDGKLWSNKGEAFSFHDPSDPTLTLLDLGSPQQAEYRFHARNEEAAENLRLLYVALTRAKHRCYLLWGNINQAETSALAWLLHQPASPCDPQLSKDNGAYDWLSATAERVKVMDGLAMRQELEQVALEAPEAVAIAPLPDGEEFLYRPPEQQEFPPAVRQCRRPVGGRWQISSFTALTSNQGVETPDYDVTIGSSAELQPVLLGAERTIFTFSRGARAGACLHAIFEQLDFAEQRSALEPTIAKTLAEFGFEADWAPVAAAMLERVLATPLEAGGPRLQEITLDRRLNELEFYYPLAGLTPEGLQQVLQTHGFAAGALRAAIDNLDFSYTQGYLKGFIDLVFEADGRFYLVDYKSNWLGMSPEAYHKQALEEVMAKESYYLQYLIYTVALHRYLGVRLPNYDYERCFGAVYYLFLRGIDPRLGAGYGIYRDRPSRALVEALDAYLDSGKRD